MPFYVSDLHPLKMRILEALDRGKTITFHELHRHIFAGEFAKLVDEAGRYPKPPIPDSDWKEIAVAIQNVLLNNKNDEAEHFYVSRNGYCLLIAVLQEIERLYAKGLSRPSS